MYIYGYSTDILGAMIERAAARRLTSSSGPAFWCRWG